MNYLIKVVSVVAAIGTFYWAVIELQADRNQHDMIMLRMHIDSVFNPCTVDTIIELPKTRKDTDPGRYQYGIQ